jgi:RNA polymerase-binding transcription factor DksA
MSSAGFLSPASLASAARICSQKMAARLFLNPRTPARLKLTPRVIGLEKVGLHPDWFLRIAIHIQEMKQKENGNPVKVSQSRAKASTQDILGGIVKRTPIDPKWAEHFKSLTRLQDQLLNDQKTLAEDAREETPNFSEHMADAATDSYDRDWALAMLSSEQNALYEIKQALNRIAHGTYGLCELSGQPIEPERLRTIPWARFSAEAQKDLETRGMGNRAHLGELGTYAKSADLSETVEEEVGETAAVAGERETA